MRALVAAIAAFALLAVPGAAHAALFPFNDDFVRQQVLFADETDTDADGAGPAALATATSELGEPPLPGAAGPVRSAWWSWTAPRSGWAEVRSCSTAFTPLLGLYTGFSVAQLTAVPATSRPARCGQSETVTYGTALGFDAVAGTAYRLVAATDGAADGIAGVAVQMQPAGDAFESAVAFPADSGLQDIALGTATVQPGEPAHGGRTATHSTWWRYTSTRRERVRVEACKANFTPVASTATIYRGSTLAGLTEVASSRDGMPCGYGGHGGQVEALLDPGVEYRIAVTLDDPIVEPLHVELLRSTRDDSALTPGKLASGSLDLAMASREEDEPAHAGQAGGRSRWQTITPTESTTYELSACSPDVYDTPVPDSLLAVYEGAAGTPAGALTPVAANDDGCPDGGGGSVVRFRALAGHRYLVAIDSKGGVPTTIALAVVASPPGDDRDRALRFYGRTGSFSTTLATAQPGEAAHAGVPASHSIWYRWAAPRDGVARVALCQASFDAVVAVYGVDPAAPVLAEGGATPGCRDPDTGAVGSGPHFDVAVTAGTTYVVAIDSAASATGPTGPLLMYLPNVDNDDFADALSLADPADPDSSVYEPTAPATAQAGEPAHAGRAAEHSSWTRWTATRTGFVTLSSCSPSPPAGSDTTLAVYTGTAVGALHPVAAADDGCGAAGGAGNAVLSFYAVEGTIYRIATDLHGSTASAVVRLLLPSANDAFDRARDVTAAGWGDGSLDAATREPGEPDHAGRAGGRSLWFAWTAPRTAMVEMYTCGSVDTLLGVYTGSAVSSLVEVASNDDWSTDFCAAGSSRVAFVAHAGTTYEIAVDGKDGATGGVAVQVQTAPAADRLATAKILDPRPSEEFVDLRLTGAEPGEPAHGGRAAVRSSWLRFQSPNTVVVEATSCAADADTVLAAYTGADVAALTTVASDDDGGGCQGDTAGARIRFTAIGGVAYAIAVDASAPTYATVQFKLLAANDALADAAPLALAPGTRMADTLAGATREAGEPEHGAGPTQVSAWYRVHVTSARTVRLTTCSEFSAGGSSARLVAYTGGSIGTLQPLAGVRTQPCAGGAAGGRISFAAGPDANVLVAVAAPAANATSYLLRVEEAPVNDRFADATAIPDDGGARNYVPETGQAGVEPGEPPHAGRPGGHSIWWSYTPATDRTVAVYACTEGSPLLAVYRGASVDALTPVAIGATKGQYAPDCVDLSFTARAGLTYHLALDADDGATGPAYLDLTPELPDHSTFAAAAPVGVPSRRIDDVEGAGPEPGEPVHAAIGRTASVWYRLDPLADGLVDISSCGVNGLDTVVAVYTGTTVDALTEVASDDEDTWRSACSFGSRDAHVAVTLQAGTRYWIAVDGAHPYSYGTFLLDIARRAPHDAFADSYELVPAVPFGADTTTATAEAGEPAHDGEHAERSVWMAWTADRTGHVVLDACVTSLRDLHLAAYTGDRVDALTRVGSNDDSPACPRDSAPGTRVDLDVVAGQRYHFAVDERYGDEPAEVTLHVAPDNDDRAAAAALPAPGGHAEVDLTAAGSEPGEPSHAGVRGGGSAWYAVTPATTTGLELGTCATEPFDSVLAVYEAAAGGALAPVAEGDDGCGSSATGARLRWRADAGHTYLVAVASAGALRGTARLDVAAVAIPGPHTRLTGAVARRTAQSSVTVAFDSDAPGTSFECRLDRDVAWSACVSPVVRSGLAEGEYAVAVRATAGGVPDESPAIAAFTVDRTAPVPVLLVPGDDALVRPREVAYEGRCGERPGDDAQYTLRIWSGETTTGTPLLSRVEPCDPWFSWTANLTVGRYTIVVTQADDVGNAGATAARHFTVAENALTVRLDAPADGAATNARRPVFSGGVAGAGDGPATVHVRAAGAAAGTPDLQTLSAPVDMTSPSSLHPFTVTATADLPEGAYATSADWSGPGGAAGSSGTSAFVVDLTPPAVAVAGPADGAVTAQDPVEVSGSGESGRAVVVTATGPGGTTVRQPYVTPAGTWGTGLPSLPDGAYVLSVRQTDAAGNVTDVPPRTIHVDRTAPAPAIVPDPPPAAVPAAPIAGPLTAVQSPPPAGPAPPADAGVSTPAVAPTARSLADRLLPGRGSVSLGRADGLGNRLFLVPGSRLRMRRAAAQTVGAAICPRTCTVRLRASIALKGGGRAIATREIGVRAGAAGRRLTIRTDARLRRRIQRARGAIATLTIRTTDARGAGRRVTAKLRLLAS